MSLFGLFIPGVFLVLYPLIGLCWAVIFLAWENDHGVARWVRVRDRWNLYKYRKHFR